MKIPLFRPDIGKEEIKAVTEVLRQDRLALGPKTEAFESRFAEITKVPHAIAVSSGTAGLHLAVRALGIAAGDEVITTPFSFISSANCMLFEGARPVFVDVDDESFCINPALVEAAITPKTKAILPVHVFGQSSDMTALMRIGKLNKLAVIEDCCESVSATHAGKVAGSFGDCGVFGFYPNKQITTGEGGMITTSDPKLAKLFFSLRNQGRGDDMQWLSHDRLGYNYRISEITSAIGLEQTRKLPEFMRKRREIVDMYRDGLEGIPGIRLPAEIPGNRHSWFVFAIRVEARIRNKLIEKLNAQGIQSKAYFDPCIHLQPFYRKEFGYKPGSFPIAEKISSEVIILPFYTKLTEAQVDFVCLTLKKLMRSLG